MTDCELMMQMLLTKQQQINHIQNKFLLPFVRILASPELQGSQINRVKESLKVFDIS